MTPPGDSPRPGPDGRVDFVLTRVGLTTPRRRDGALAVLMALVSVAAVLVGLAEPALAEVLGTGPVTVPAVLVLLVVQSGALVVRRSHPTACLAATIALQIVLAGALPPTGYLRGPAPVVAAYTCGERLPARRALALAGIAAVVETVGFAGFAMVAAPDTEVATAAGRVLGQLVSSLVTYVALALLGGYVATRRRYAEMARLHAAEAVEAQRARADAAVAAERTRMARELHDIAAHHLAAMVVQASMAERLIDRDPDAARRTVAEIRAQGRTTLQDLRLVVGTLRERGDDDAAGDGEPVPGLAVLEQLVARAGGASGVPVELRVLGTPRELSPVADVSFYRVAQEALSNARDHAPGAPVAVRVEHGDSATLLEVRNGPAGGSTDGTTGGVTGAVTGGTTDAPDAHRPPRRGLGLVGMRERAEMMGADLAVGPLDDGGWRVRLELPRTEGSRV